MAREIQAHRWDSTPLGPVEQWPSALRIALSLILNSGFPKAIFWGPELVTFYNDAYRPILGRKEDVLGRSFCDVWYETWSTLEPMVSKTLAGEAVFVENMPLRVKRNAHVEEAYFTFCYSPIRDETGAVLGVLETVIETTETVLAQRQARVVNAELAHRIQNTLAVIAAIVEQTFRAGHSMEDTRQRLNERIVALGRAHRLLTRTRRNSAPLAALIEEALAPHAPLEQFDIEGPPIDIPAKKVLSLSLALNELATNAVKHGALSTDRGRVAIEWRVTGEGPDSTFELAWTEKNGPVPIPPTSRGFGSRLLERILPHDFGGSSRLIYGPTGLRYELTRRGPFSSSA